MVVHGLLSVVLRYREGDNMAFTSNAPIKPAELISLKAKVKAEVQRRNQSGSVSAYGSATYDYNSTDNPTSAKPLLPGAYNKIIDPAKSIGDIGTHNTISSGNVLKADGDINSKVDVWKARNLQDRTSTDCKSGCTGTCYTGCATGCYTGCTSCNGCTGCSGCGSGCGGCDGGCSGCQGCGGCGGCGTICEGSCEGCGGSCGSKCFMGCDWNCVGNNID